MIHPEASSTSHMNATRSRRQQERSWAEICCFGCSCLQHFWPTAVIRKLLNFSANESSFSADPEEEENSDSESDTEETIPRARRRKSETFRSQYINTKELRVCVGTWNVAGKIPPDDLDIEDWLDFDEPADIYVVGLQEIVPLNAGNIFGAEDSSPVPKWENIIRETLNRIRPVKTKIKCYSDPSSPSRFKPSEDIPNIEEEILLETDSDVDEEIHPVDIYPVDEESDDFDVPGSTTGANSGSPIEPKLQKQFSSSKRLDRLNCLCMDDCTGNEAPTVAQQDVKLTRTLSGLERISLSWPEPPLHLLAQHVLERPRSFKSVKSFTSSKSFKTLKSFKSFSSYDPRIPPEITLLQQLDLESLVNRKRKSPFVRIVSKQMVGIFLTIWVRRSLRRHIQNVKVSTVGVGIMGYIGNKGSISVSMSIYQTLFCFICTHLTSGEKDGDEAKRNTDVHEIHRRTHFHSLSSIGLPKSIHDHERIFWLGDLNYRINLPYEKARELISKKEWSKLFEKDQLIRELRKGRAFSGWSEGALNFPPTYKYENNSDKYCGEDPKVGRRTPAWCDRVLSYGKGLRLLSYRRTELRFSDHRPVTATYMVEVEEFSPRKLQKALTFTDAEIGEEEILTDMGMDAGLNHLRLREHLLSRER